MGVQMTPLEIGKAVLALLAIAGLGVFYIRRRHRAFRRFSASLGRKALRSHRSYEAELDGRRYEYRYRESTQSQPPSFDVQIDASSPGEFDLRRERFRDRLFKRLGVAVELQSGEPAFDEGFYIHTGSAGFCRVFFGRAEVREAVRKLLSLGYTRLRHDGRRLEAVCSPFSPFRAAASQPQSFVEGAVRELGVLATQLPQQSRALPALDAPPWRGKRATVFAVVLCSLVVGAGTGLWGWAAYPPLDPLQTALFSLRYSGAALVAFLGVATLLLRGRSASHRELFLAGGLALFGFPLSGLGSLLVLNGLADGSPAVHHERKVLERHETYSRGFTTHSLYVRSWRPGHRRERVRVSESIHRSARAGESVLRVTTRAGRYGFEWVEAYRIVER